MLARSCCCVARALETSLSSEACCATVRQRIGTSPQTSGFGLAPPEVQPQASEYVAKSHQQKGWLTRQSPCGSSAEHPASGPQALAQACWRRLQKTRWSRRSWLLAQRPGVFTVRPGVIIIQNVLPGLAGGKKDWRLCRSGKILQFGNDNETITQWHGSSRRLTAGPNFPTRPRGIAAAWLQRAGMPLPLL